MAKLLGKIYQFVQVGEETLYQAWERFNGLLYRCPTHDLNKHQIVYVFYRGINAQTRELLDSPRPIPSMTPDQALECIQRISEHCYKWHMDTGYGPRHNFDHKVMKTKTKQEYNYGEIFAKRRIEREVEACKIERVKSVFGTKTGSNLEKKILDHINESRERDNRIEKMMKKFVDNTVSYSQNLR